MRNINLKEALAVSEIEDFGGISHIEKAFGGKGARDICNFRILKDGSLEKRNGFAPVMTLPDTPRAFYFGYYNGIPLNIVLIGSDIYLVDIDAGTSTPIASIGTSEGAAQFFFYRGGLYLIDGDEFYRYTGHGFEPFKGYIPLYGNGWGGRYTGEIYEPINFLSDKIRIYYKLEHDLNSFYVGVKCTSIVSFIANGTDYTSRCSLSDDGKKINFTGGAIPSKSEVFVCLTLDTTQDSRSILLSSTRAVIYGGRDDSRVLLYGGENLSSVYVSRKVSDLSLEESREYDSSTIGVYFPVSDRISISEGRYPITAVCPHYDRLLIFTERETWMADFTTQHEEPNIVPINSSVGCVSENGVASGLNNPYTVSRDGIYRWTSKDDERNECNAVCISDEISDSLGQEFFERAVAFYRRRGHEIWFADPESDEQEVWVYFINSGKWSRFDGIPVDLFFSYKGDVGMIYGKYVFAFSANNYDDTACDGSTHSKIEAYYESNATDFAHPERLKRLKRLALISDGDEGDITISLNGDMGGEKTITINGQNAEVSEGDSVEDGSIYAERRVDIGRFRGMNYTIRSDGEGRTRIRKILLCAYK